MEIKIDNQEGKTLVVIDGRIDTTTVDRFQQEANALL